MNVNLDSEVMIALQHSVLIIVPNMENVSKINVYVIKITFTPIVRWNIAQTIVQTMENVIKAIVNVSQDSQEMDANT